MAPGWRLQSGRNHFCSLLVPPAVAGTGRVLHTLCWVCPLPVLPGRSSRVCQAHKGLEEESPLLPGLLHSSSNLDLLCTLFLGQNLAQSSHPGAAGPPWLQSPAQSAAWGWQQESLGFGIPQPWSWQQLRGLLVAHCPWELIPPGISQSLRAWLCVRAVFESGGCAGLPPSGFPRAVWAELASPLAVCLLGLFTAERSCV